MRRCKSLLYAGGAVHLILLFIYYYVQQLRAHSAGQGGKNDTVYNADGRGTSGNHHTTDGNRSRKRTLYVEELRELIAKGQVIIPCNKNHKSISPSGVGAKLTTKINVNLGVSRDWKDVDMEYEKVHSAVEMGAEAIMDLSSYGDTRSFRRKLTSECPAMIGTVPIYDAVVYYHKALGKITSEEWIDIVRMHAEDGVDFMTIHCGMNRATAARFKQNKRLMNIVSRGGSIMFAWMEMTGKENPFYEHFDEILDICREYDITLSLGDACRPGCIADATDTAQIEELITLGELTKRAWERMFRL